MFVWPRRRDTVRAHHPGHVIEREVVLMKVDTSVELDQGSDHKFEALSLKRDRIMALAKLFDAEMVDVGSRAMTIQLTSWPRRIDAFLKFAGPYGIIETARSGVVVSWNIGILEIWKLEIGGNCVARARPSGISAPT